MTVAVHTIRKLASKKSTTALTASIPPLQRPVIKYHLTVRPCLGFSTSDLGASEAGAVLPPRGADKLPTLAVPCGCPPLCFFPPSNT